MDSAPDRFIRANSDSLDQANPPGRNPVLNADGTVEIRKFAADGPKPKIEGEGIT